jgi:hypothetical protein
VTAAGIYRVIGNRRYRGHEPGTEFSARLEPLAESRAITRGDLELVDRMEPELPRGAFRLPVGWTESPQERSGTRAGSRLTTLEKGGK